MKSSSSCIAIAVILASCFSAQAASQPQQPDMPIAWTSLVAWPIASPQPVLCTDDKTHLVYELLVMNVSASDMMLDRLETLDASKGDAGVNTKSGDAIVATLQGGRPRSDDPGVSHRKHQNRGTIPADPDLPRCEVRQRCHPAQGVDAPVPGHVRACHWYVPRSDNPNAPRCACHSSLLPLLSGFRLLINVRRSK